MDQNSDNCISLPLLIDFNFGPDLNGTAALRAKIFFKLINTRENIFLAEDEIHEIAHNPTSERSYHIIKDFQNNQKFIIVLVHSWLLANDKKGKYIDDFLQNIILAEIKFQHIALSELKNDFLIPLTTMWTEISQFVK